MLDWRAQLIACSTDVVMTPSSKRPSIQGCVIGVVPGVWPRRSLHTAARRPLVGPAILAIR
jgi:hypothetical protein